MSPEAAFRYAARLQQGKALTVAQYDEIAQVLRQWAAGQADAKVEHVEFELCATGFKVDGMTVPMRKSIGLPMAWLILAAQQTRVGDVMVEWFFPGKDGPRNAVQALYRAACAVRPLSPILAMVIESIGTRRGVFVFRSPVRGIACTSPALVAALA